MDDGVYVPGPPMIERIKGIKRVALGFVDRGDWLYVGDLDYFG